VDNESLVHRFAASIPGMPQIEVDPATLAATSAALASAAAVAREVHKGARVLSDAADAGGSGELAAALEEFRSTWGYGLGLVVDDATTLSRMLSQAAEAYRHTDGAVAGACGP
jgi:hypothetical protein